MTAFERERSEMTAPKAKPKKRRTVSVPGGGDGEMNEPTGGFFVLENAYGQAVRSFRWEPTRIVVVYRQDNRRVETFASTEELDAAGIPYVLLAESTQSQIKRAAVSIGGEAGAGHTAFRGRVKWVSDVIAFPSRHELAKENGEDAKRVVGYVTAAQFLAVGLVLLSGAFFGRQAALDKPVTILPQEVVEKMLEQEGMKELPKPIESKPEKAPKAAQRAPQDPSKIVVAPSETKITKNTPIPTRSSSFKKTAHVAKSKGPRAGGYKGEGRRGYGTDEAHMNQIGALGALDNAARVKGGNGGRGGLNLQAVGTEAGSGAGGKGHGGFGSNGGGGKGLGGIGTGKGMGLSNAMYGKGLVAAPFGDGSPAPGAGGYGTRGKAGGGAQGAGYGSMTIVGSWKGTGPKGNGPAGSGAGNGGPGSPWGTVDGASDDDVLVTGGLDRDQIAEVIARNIGQITYCYEQGLQKKSDLSGRVSVRFQIGGAGRVSTSRVANSSVRSAQVEQCIAGKVRNWIFPKPVGGVNVAVTYPFVLRRVSQR